MEVLLLRHGTTEGNAKHRYIGRTDEPLSPQGRALAASLRGLHEASCVFVSPLLRARQTASVVFPGAKQTVIDDFREMDFGDFENRSPDDMEDDAIYRAWVDGGCVEACPGGESMAGFSSRVRAAFDSAVKRAMASGESRMVIVAHGGTLMAILDGYAYERRLYFEWYAPNCGGWRAVLDEGAWDERPALRECVRLSTSPEWNPRSARP